MCPLVWWWHEWSLTLPRFWFNFWWLRGVAFCLFGSWRSGWSAASAVHHMLRHMCKSVIARRFTDVRAIKLGRGFKFKQGTNEYGTHLLHGEGHAYPVLLQQHLPAVSLLCVFAMCQSDQVSVPPPTDGMCVKSEACQSMWDGVQPRLWCTAPVTPGFVHRNQQILRDEECGARNELRASRIVPSFHAEK